MFDNRLLLACIAVSGLCVAATGSVSAGQGGAATPAVPSPPVRAGQQSPPIQSGTAMRRPLSEVVQALEMEHGVVVMDPWGAIEGADSSTTDLGGQAPEAAFRALLGNFELLFYYPAAGVGGDGRLAEVWVYPPGMLDRQFLGPQAGQPGVPMEGSAASRRAAMIESVLMRDPATAEAVVLQGMKDGSGEVRARTVAAATGMGVPIPREMLVELLHSDPAEEVRGAAVDALVVGAGTDINTLREIMEQAQRDPSPLVQAKAVELANLYFAPAGVPDTEPIVPEGIEVPPESPPGGLVQPAEGIFSPPLR